MCFEYDDSSDIFEQSVVKCRKPHKCDGCWRVIRKGEPATCCSGLFDRSWFRYYVCNRCQRLIYAIAAKELRDGCPWHTAWISPQELREYLGELKVCMDDDIELMGLDTLDDCMRYVNDLYETIRSTQWPPSHMHGRLVELEAY